MTSTTAAADSASLSPPPRPKLLIVDDMPANLVVLKRVLNQVDADIITAASGNEALKLTLGHDFALVLLDVQMPGIDGYEVAELMRGEERTREVPIIFVTAAHKDNADRRRGYGAGAVDYIEKPIDEVALLSKVRVFIELYRSQSEMRRLLGLLTEANRGLNSEIEARRRSEDESARLAGTIFAASAEAIMVCDAANRIVAVNPAFTQITGYPAAEVIGHNPGMLRSGQHDPDFYGAMWEELHRTGRWQGELFNRRKDGGIYPQWLSISVIRRDDGSVDRYVAIFSDITERKRGERELQESRLAAEQANRAKSHFLANISHELRTPLNAILGFSELIMIESDAAGLSSRHHEYVANIHDSGQHLLDLVNDLLDLSKIEAGKWRLTPTRFAIAPLVEECGRMLQADVRTAGVTLDLVFGEQPLTLRADLRAVRQCLLNLLSNAVKFTPAGGRVTVSAGFEGAMVAIRVADTGIGIADKDVPRLMHPFEQADSSHSRNSKGTGLGLAMVRSLVDLHGGRMSIDSHLGEGTTVTLLLPAAESES